MMWVWLACVTPEEDVTPRTIYNDGIVLMESANWSEAEDKFLEARDQAQTDQSLRADTAYNLGLTYAKEAAWSTVGAVDMQLKNRQLTTTQLKTGARVVP